jgi:hypothetical protein
MSDTQSYKIINLTREQCVQIDLAIEERIDWIKGRLRDGNFSVPGVDEAFYRERLEVCEGILRLVRP